MLFFGLGFSLSLNVSLVAFLIFVFKNKKLGNLIYDNFNENVGVLKESNDPFKDIQKGMI